MPEEIINSMESNDVFNISESTPGPSTTEAAEKFDLSNYLLKNYIVIIIPSVFVCIFLIIIFLILIKKIINRHRFDPRQLETYSSVTYDDEGLEDELGSTDDLMYTSCKLLVGGDYEQGELTNSEPEYDCMSVDVSVNANESSIVNWDQNRVSRGVTQNGTHNVKTLPRSFWRS